MMAPLQEAFSGMHSCLSFTFVHEIYFLLGDKEKMPKPLSQVKTRMIKHIYSLCKTFTVCSTHLHSVQHIYTQNRLLKVGVLLGNRCLNGWQKF